MNNDVDPVLEPALKIARLEKEVSDLNNRLAEHVDCIKRLFTIAIEATRTLGYDPQTVRLSEAAAKAADKIKQLTALRKIDELPASKITAEDCGISAIER